MLTLILIWLISAFLVFVAGLIASFWDGKHGKLYSSPEDTKFLSWLVLTGPIGLILIFLFWMILFFELLFGRIGELIKNGPFRMANRWGYKNKNE